MSRRRLIASSAALVVAAATPAVAAARVDSGPSLHVVTTLAGHRLPVPMADTSGWKSDAGVWTATIRSASTAGGETQIDSEWTSPVFYAKPRRTFFTFAMDVAHQGAPFRVNAFVQGVRICLARGRCSRWVSIAVDDLPDQYTTAVPFQVTEGLGLSLATLNDSFRAYAQFRFHQVQGGLDEQTMTMRVAVGAAARRLDHKQPT